MTHDTSAIPSPTSVEADAEGAIRRIGARVRALRVAAGLTLQDVADRTGVSVSMLSMLERGQSGGSIGTMVAVSSALGVPLAQLFAVPVPPADQISRQDRQTQVELAAGVNRRTVHPDVGDGLEIVVLELAAGTDTGSEAVRHGGDEYAVVLAGVLSVDLDGVQHVLATGDGIVVKAGELHRFANQADAPMKVLLATLSPTH